MQIIDIKSKEQLNNFLTAQEKSSFSQSWEWGEFQKDVGNQIFRLGVTNENGETIGVATLIKKNLPLGKSYFFCPRGPIVSDVKNSDTDTGNELKNEGQNGKHHLIIERLFAEIKDLAKKEKAIFFRFEPVLPITDGRLAITRTLDIEPSKTLMLDLSKSEDDLLSAMHQKTRYNIRLAEKKGVRIEEAGAEKFEVFWRLMEQTGERDSFRLHGRDHYRLMLEAMTFAHEKDRKTAKARLFIAYNDDTPIAVLLACFFGDSVTYLHGGSSNTYRNLMAPYALQWHLIRTARQEGFRYYDLFGVDENKWPGVTRFKKGFGGFDWVYPGTFDLSYATFWYFTYQVIRKINRLR